MRIEDAPPAGWYPDPEGGSRLRWWEGTDWADRWRAPPTPGVVEIKSAYEAEHAGDTAQQAAWNANAPTVQVGGMSRADSQAIITQVREAARQEAERAAAMFGREARNVASGIGPLIDTYTSRFVRFIRMISVIAVILLIAYVAFQIFAQASLFEWIGDRIDSLTDDESGAAAARLVRPLMT